LRLQADVEEVGHGVSLKSSLCGFLGVTRFTIRRRTPRHNVRMQTFDLQTGGFTRFELFTAAAAIWLGLGFVSLFLEADHIVADVHARVSHAVEDSPLLWYAVEVDGQQAVLHGVAESDADAAQALVKARLEPAATSVVSRLLTLPDAARCQHQLDVFLRDAPVRFKAGGEELEAESLESLQRMAAVIRQCSHKVEVAAHTELRGDTSLNQQLSARRADTVARHLVRSGVTVRQISVVGYGESQPLVAGETSGQTNERVTFRVAGASV